MTQSSPFSFACVSALSLVCFFVSQGLGLRMTHDSRTANGAEEIAK